MSNRYGDKRSSNHGGYNTSRRSDGSNYPPSTKEGKNPKDDRKSIESDEHENEAKKKSQDRDGQRNSSRNDKKEGDGAISASNRASGDAAGGGNARELSGFLKELNEQLAGSKKEEKKFTQRNRLFVGNLPQNITEEEFKEMFSRFGETNEVFLNRMKGFGFIRLDTRHNAEVAKNALDGIVLSGRTLRCRFATHGAALKVKNLHRTVSNELLEEAFQQFGSIERAVVIVDDRGNSTGEGIVEFIRKPAAQQAMKKIQEGVFLLTSSPRPVTVDILEQKDEVDGQPDRYIQRNEEFKRERETEPRFASRGSFESEIGIRWKELYDMEKQQRDQFKVQIEDGHEKLEMEMENALHEQQAALLRQDLMRRQEELRRLEEQRIQDTMRRQRDFEQRRKTDEEQRRREEIMMRQQQEEIMMRHLGQKGAQQRGGYTEDMLAMQYQQLTQQQMMGGGGGSGGGGGGGQGHGHGGYSGSQGQSQSQSQGQMIQNQNQRQSRFDQPPVAGGPGQQSFSPNQQMGSNQMMGGGGGIMDSPQSGGGMGYQHRGGNQGNNMRGSRDDNTRGHHMDRDHRDRRPEESYDSKRQRRY